MRLTPQLFVSRRNTLAPLGRLVAVILTTFGAWGSSLGTAQEFSDADLEFFEKEIRPILAEHCWECHGANEQEASLRLDARQFFLKGGDSGPVLKIGEPQHSLLIEVVEYAGEYQMPPDSKLPAAQIEALRKWVALGAPWPNEDLVEGGTVEAFDLAARKSAHWCWQPMSQPAVPNVIDTAWPRNELDRFVLAKLEEMKLRPAAPADRGTWLRRVTFDLIGLPPTPEELAEFLQDKTPNAAEKVVDRLLASPRFGEHWARRWMDLTRYAETHGHEFDYPIDHAHHYRDYLIRAFNADVPYNQFLQEHLAGDLVEQPRLHPELGFNESVLGTGFWFLGEATHGPVDVKGDEAGRIDNQIDVMTKTFMGLTVACARCHDHKFDAISTADYYALSGFLQSSRRQTVLLDEGNRIAQGLQQLEDERRSAEEAAREWMNHLRDPSPERVAEFLTVAHELLQTRPRLPTPIVIEGESWAGQVTGAGTVEAQHLGAIGGEHLQGDAQLWWRDAPVGSTLSLPFSVPQEGVAQVTVRLLQAPDYGQIKFWLDDRKDEAVEFEGYAAKLSAASPLVVAERELSAGEHHLRIELTGHNPAAAPRGMVGLDFVQVKFSGADQSLAAWTTSRNKAAENRGWRPEWLQRLTEALDAWPGESTEAGGLIARMWRAMEPVDWQTLEQEVAALRQARAQLQLPTADTNTTAETSVLWEDFGGDWSRQWFPTGWAFAGNWGANTNQPRSFLAADGQWINESVATSGRLGGGVQGSLRSPTFEITHDLIHYRMRGENVQIRVIIDGFQLDLFNSLLFAGVSLDVPATGSFRWVTQGGDLKNYRGHRAYLEINDLGNGWIELDKIVFSNQGPLRTADDWELSLIEQALHQREKLTTVADRAAWLALQFTESLQSSEPPAWLLNWIAQHELEPLFGATPVTFVEQPKIREPDLAAAHRAQWKNHLERLRQSSLALPSPRRAIGMTDGTPEDEYVFIRGNHKMRGPIVPRRNLQALAGDDVAPMATWSGSGRRELARQLVEPEHPLTSRVIVNRLWHHLLGRGIVGTVDNFGVLGETPSHPELLDFSARQFIRDNWSIKSFLKKICLSATYAQGTQADPRAEQVDPENHWFHSARVKRLSGEALRDSLLAISGELKTEMYGPSVPVHLTEFMQGRGRPGASGPLDGGGRRSVYLEVRRNFLNPLMLAFDTPIPFNAMGKRNSTNVPAQSLILMNDPFLIQQARRWAERVIATESEGQSSAEERDTRIRSRVSAMLERALSRPGSAAEIQLGERFILEEAAARSVNSDQVLNHIELWQDWAHVIFNLKAFTFVY